MKACYFIQTHKNPKQIYRLVRTIKKSSPTAQIIIGHDSTRCHLDMAPLQDLSNIYLLKGNVPAIRKHFSLVQPYLNAINWLVEHNVDFDWLIYLSGQDYPTQPLWKFENFLSQTKYDGFLEYFDVFSKQSVWDQEESLNRYFYQYWCFPQRTRFLLWLLLKTLKTTKILNFTPIKYRYSSGDPLFVGLPAKKTVFNEKFICYGGFQWHTLSRKCVVYIKSYIDNNLDFVKYYKKTIIPDESLIQTILVNSNLFKFCNDNKVYVDWPENNDSHPRILGIKDYSKITSGSFYFARKFEQDAEILDMLDAKIFQ